MNYDSFKGSKGSMPQVMKKFSQRKSKRTKR